MTTASTMTQGGKKAVKGRKATTGKGRKTKVKKDDAIEILEDEPQTLEPPTQNPARGRKRASDAMEDSAVTNAEAPAPKKRATRVRASSAVDVSNSAAPLPDTDMEDTVPAKQPAPKKRARASTTKKTRKVSQSSVRSQASTASLRGDLPDDDEIDRQLEAELERYHSDADDLVIEKAPVPAKGRPKKAAAARKTSTQGEMGQSESYAMFDPTPIIPDEAEIEAEFKALRAEMVLEQPAATDSLVVPKKGRKTGTRKASKQTKKAKEPVPQPNQVEEVADDVPISEPAQGQEPEQTQHESEPEPADDADASTGTVVTKPASRPSIEKRGRGRPSKQSIASQVAAEEFEQRRSSTVSVQIETQTGTPLTRGSISKRKSTPGKILRKPVPVASQPPPAPTQIPAPAAVTPAKTEKALPAPPSSTDRLPHQPTTPRSAGITPSRFAAQAAISPSQSPQSSDAENQPPSSKPAAGPPNALTKHTTVLAPAPNTATTPMRSTSPSKRNVIAGLQSTAPWQPADMDMILSFSPKSGAEDGDGDDAAARQLVLHHQQLESYGGGGGGELASPERHMTVEEWIYYNAGLAEQQLKRECEEMVSAFEREGSRAMRVLEGLVVE
jgi:hypothetical protein